MIFLVSDVKSIKRYKNLEIKIRKGVDNMEKIVTDQWEILKQEVQRHLDNEERLEKENERLKSENDNLRQELNKSMFMYQQLLEQMNSSKKRRKNSV